MTYLSDVDIAARLAISRVTVWRWAEQGRFPRPIRLGPNCTRWRAEDVADWEATRLAESGGEAA